MNASSWDTAFWGALIISIMQENAGKDVSSWIWFGLAVLALVADLVINRLKK